MGLRNFQISMQYLRIQDVIRIEDVIRILGVWLCSGHGQRTLKICNFDHSYGQHPFETTDSPQ